VVHFVIRNIVVSRRALLKGAALAIAAPLIQRGRFCLFADSEVAYSSSTLDLVQRSTVIDMLGLLTLDYPKLCSWMAEPGLLRAEGSSKAESLRNHDISSRGRLHWGESVHYLDARHHRLE
jgi:hypothetical protein